MEMIPPLRIAVGLSRRGSSSRLQRAAGPLAAAVVAALLGLVFVFDHRLTAVDALSTQRGPVLDNTFFSFVLGQQLKAWDNMLPGERDVDYDNPRIEKTGSYGVVKRVANDDLTIRIPKINVEKVKGLTQSSTDDAVARHISFDPELSIKLSLPSATWFTEEVLQAVKANYSRLKNGGDAEHERFIEEVKEAMNWGKKQHGGPIADVENALEKASDMIIRFTILNATLVNTKGSSRRIIKPTFGWETCSETDALWEEFAAKLAFLERDQKQHICDRIKAAIADFYVKTAKSLLPVARLPRRRYSRP